MDFDFSTFDTIHTQPNIFGGDDIFGPNNEMWVITQPNIFDGSDFMTPDGSIFATSQPNIFGGFDISMNVSSNPFASTIPDFIL